MVGVWDGMKLGWIPTDEPPSQSYPNIPKIRRCSTILPEHYAEEQTQIYIHLPVLHPPSLLCLFLLSPVNEWYDVGSTLAANAKTRCNEREQRNKHRFTFTCVLVFTPYSTPPFLLSLVSEQGMRVTDAKSRQWASSNGVLSQREFNFPTQFDTNFLTSNKED